MNCHQAIRLLPLWVGHDLADASEAEGLRTHVQNCPSCSRQLRQLRESLEALQSVSSSSLTMDSNGRVGLWPRLSAQLKDVPRRRDHFNGWIPAAAMAVAATLMIGASVVQVRRDLGAYVQTMWGDNRDLFKTDSRFAAGSDDSQDLKIPGLVVAPLDEEPGF